MSDTIKVYGFPARPNDLDLATLKPGSTVRFLKNGDAEVMAPDGSMRIYEARDFTKDEIEEAYRRERR